MSLPNLIILENGCPGRHGPGSIGVFAAPNTFRPDVLDTGCEVNEVFLEFTGFLWGEFGPIFRVTVKKTPLSTHAGERV